jgi:pimeloyl-ACP methyl ester carboxylesterase
MTDHQLDGLDHGSADTGEVSLHYVTAGPEDGDPVVLLHGFPEFWYGWREQIPALQAAGYRVIVPDQRGYNRSDKPSGLDAYTVDTLARDVVGLLAALGYDSARVVGHDWGAGVLWRTVLCHPDCVERAVVMNVPHPAVFRRFLTSEPRQLANSYYRLLWQLPVVPELALRAGGWRGLRWFIDTSNRDDTFTRTDIERYRDAWSRPGAITAMLNWYRALLRRDVEDPPTTAVRVPTLILWGRADPYLMPEMAGASAEYCRNGRLEWFRDATHWLQHEVPGRVNQSLLDFLDGE